MLDFFHSIVTIIGIFLRLFCLQKWELHLS